MREKPSFFHFLWSLFTIGLTAYGGPAIIAQLHRELVAKKKWVTEEEFAESVAFAQLIPGPVVPATAAHAAQRIYGPVAVFPTVLAYALPAFALMAVLSALYFRWGQLPPILASFRALGPVIVGIVASSCLQMAQPALRDLRGFFLAAVLVPLFVMGINPVLVVVVGSLAGLAVFRQRLMTGTSLVSPQGSRRQALAWGGVAGAILVCGATVLTVFAPNLARLALELAKISLMAFGGGYTAVGLMYHAFVESHPPVMGAREFLNGLALGQLTPGPVIITGAFVGYKLAGFWGALVGTLYTFLPPTVLVSTLSPHVSRLRDSVSFWRAVRGALAAFVALLLHVLMMVAKETLTPPWAGPVALIAFTALARRVPVIILVVMAVAAGLLGLS